MMNRQNKAIRDLSLYIHIPFCKRKCGYCDFLSFGGCDDKRQRDYVSALCREIESYGKMAQVYCVKTVFLGGGTPSYMDADLIEQIMTTVYSVFAVDKAAEITIEGNPDSLTKEKLETYRKLGINRLSIGLQSANDDMLKLLGRIHNYEQFYIAYTNARQAGFANINIDLMSGLPGEKEESYTRTLDQIVKLKPEHISAYSLIVEEDTPLSQNEELLELLPSEEEDRQLYGKTKSLLKNSGYIRYEISNYAKSGFECRHNLVYWTGSEYLGVGLGASSYLTVQLDEKSFQKIRFHGVEHLDEYIGRFSKCDGMMEDAYTDFYHLYETEHSEEKYDIYEGNLILNFIRNYYQELYFSKSKDEMEEFMFLGLRLMKGISKKEFQERFGVTINKIYGKIIDKYKERKLLIEDGDNLFLSDAGIDVSNVVMAEFML